MITKKFRGYTVEFVKNDDSTNCYIEKGKFCSSLAFAMDVGILEDPVGREHKISDDIVDEIYEWALELGY